MKIINACTAQNAFLIFNAAESFVLPYEKICCTLMQKILEKDNSVFVICEDSDLLKIHGVIAYTKSHFLFHCLPEKSKEIFDSLLLFLLNEKPFGISGEASGSEFIRQAVFIVWKCVPDEMRDYYFMEQAEKSILVEHSGCNVIKSVQAVQRPSVSFNGNAGVTVFKCSQSDEKQLFPLHTGYVKEEVLPAWKKINPAAERLSLHETLASQLVLGLVYKNQIVSKAQTNALGKNFSQIGGVYTLPEFRKNGFACQLVIDLCQIINTENKKAVLFVKEKNTPALHAYGKAGFEITGSYKIYYYK